MLNSTDAAYQKMILNVDKRIGNGVPEAVIIDALQDSFRVFSHETESWLLKTEHDADGSTLNFSAVGDTGAQVRRILSVKARLPGSESDFVHTDKVAQQCWDLSGDEVVFNSYFQMDVYNGGKIEIVASLTPYASNTTIDEGIAGRYCDALIFGAIAMIAAQKNRPWYDPDLYALYVSKFHAEETHALCDMASGFKTSSRGFTG